MNDRIRKLARLSMLLALATAIHAAEAMLPVTVAWFRFGFANIIGLATLELFGFKDALLVTIGRVLLGSLTYGLIGSPAFMMSMAGGVAAMAVMGLAHRLAGKGLSEVGISVLGATAHNLAQLAVAYLILIRNEAILMLIPVMLLAAAGTGFMNGLAARFFVGHFKKASGENAIPG